MDASFETQGVILFRNIFQLSPESLGLFSFKDEENLYENPKLKRHGAAVCKYVDQGIANLTGAVDPLKKLGKRHDNRGIKSPHYEVVGQALLITLETALGAEFTAESKENWTELYALIAKTMQEHG